MSKRQERTAKADKKAKATAEAVVAEAVGQAVAKAKRGALPAEHAALADEVKRLRETGMAWWQIGHELHLPGSADNVAQGKGGAAYARKIWKAAFGDVPRVQNRDGSRRDTEKNATVKAIKKQRKVDRVEQVRTGVAVINENMSDDEILEMLRGRTIGWSFDMDRLDHKGEQFVEQEAGIHHRFAKIEMHKGERCIAFREYDATAPLKVRGVPGPTRIVRLSTIHTVR